jgi:hypothetical protein
MANSQAGAEPGDVSTTGQPSWRERLVGGALVLLGLGLAGSGIAAVFTSDSDAGAAALVGVGSLLVLFVATADRLESLRYGDLELRLRRKADEAAARGDHESAKILQRAADTVGERVARTARSYRSVRGTMPPGDERTARMGQIMREARLDAMGPDLDEEEVLNILWTGSEGARVWAIAVLQERPELATTRAILEAVQRPDQMFDQYEALELADRFVSLTTTRTWARERIAEAVRLQLESGKFGKDRDCLDAAERLLEHVDALMGHHPSTARSASRRRPEQGVAATD